MTFSSDMMPPSHDVEPYDVPRGTCPRCGSGRVRHHVIGDLIDPEAMHHTPSWVVWEGCIHPGHTRSCRACGETWIAPEEDDEPVLADL